MATETITKTFKISSKDESIDEIQVIQCHYFEHEDNRKQYSIEGWFGYSQAYANWDDALRDIAHRHSFKYEQISGSTLDHIEPTDQPKKDSKKMPKPNNNEATQEQFTKNIRALLTAGKRQATLVNVCGLDIRKAFCAGKLDAWLTPILKNHDSEANPIGHKNLLQLVRDNSDSKLSLMPIEKGSRKGYKINAKPATRNVKAKIAQLIKNNENAIALANKIDMPTELRATLVAVYSTANESLADEANKQAGTNAKTPKTETPKTKTPKSNVIKYGSNGKPLEGPMFRDVPKPLNGEVLPKHI